MSALTHDLRIAFRYLWRNLTFSTAAVAILAMGICLSATLFAIVKGALLAPWPYRGYDRIVTVTGDYPTQGRTRYSLWSVPEIDDLRRESNIFEHVIAGDARNVNLTYNDRAERVRAAVITPNAFTMLGVPALIGRTLTAADAAAGAVPTVVISFHFWQSRLGADPDAVGRVLRLGDTAFTITGIMPKGFVFWDRELWMPLALDARDLRTDRRYYVQAQLRPDVDAATAAARLQTFARRLAGDHAEVPEYRGLTIETEPLVERVLRDLRPMLQVLVAAVVLVIVVAIANLANATLARGLTREGELAIRRAIGASTGQLARQLLAESALLGATGGLVGAAAAAFLLPQVVALIPYGYIPAEANVEFDWRIVTMATAAAVGCGLLIGLIPAVRAGSVDPSLLLKQSDTRTGSRRRRQWSNAFVFAQVALAVVVSGAAGTAAVGLRAAIERDPGYRSTDVWTARIALPETESTPRARTETFQQVLSRIRANPSIEDAGLASAFPFGELPTTLVAADGTTGSFASREAAVIAVSPTFFDLLGWRVIDGRPFADDDAPPRRPPVIVTRNLAESLWPNGPTIGRRLIVNVGTDALDAIVVGVVGNMIPNGAIPDAQPGVFVPIAHRAPAAVVVGLRTRGRADAFAILNAAVKSVDPDIPVYGAEMLEQSRRNVLGPRLLTVTLLAAFAVAVLTLSAIGIYAVVAHSVEERAHEMRIRLTLGADPRRLLVAEFLRAGKVVTPALVAGFTAALAALRLLAHSFVGFSASPAAPLTIATVVLVSLAAVSAGIPAWRGTRYAS